MTTKELRHLMCGDAERFTLPTRVLKDRLGNPDDIRILSKWCKTTGRDVVLMTFVTEEGCVEVFCPIGFVNGEETVMDGWIGASSLSPTARQESPNTDQLRGIDHLRGLFYQESEPASQRADEIDTPKWRSAKQRSFADECDDTTKPSTR